VEVGVGLGAVPVRTVPGSVAVASTEHETGSVYGRAVMVYSEAEVWLMVSLIVDWLPDEFWQVMRYVNFAGRPAGVDSAHNPIELGSVKVNGSALVQPHATGLPVPLQVPALAALAEPVVTVSARAASAPATTTLLAVAARAMRLLLSIVSCLRSFHCSATCPTRGGYTGTPFWAKFHSESGH
jgi:hypothetical protein